MAKIDWLLERGIAFAKEGFEANARSLFRAVIEEEPKNQFAWGWYVQSYQDEDERIQAFDEYLSVFPQDQEARRLQNSLIKQQYKRWKLIAVDAIQDVNDAEGLLETGEVKKRKAIGMWVALMGLVLIAAIYLLNAITAQKIDALTSQLMAISENYDILRQDYASLQAAHQTLKVAYESLNQDYASLMASFVELDQKYINLTTDYSDLNNRFGILNTDYQILSNEYQALFSKYAILTGEYDRLETISLQPPYISVHNREITMAFYDMSKRLVYWSIPFSNLEYYIVYGNKTRNQMFKQRVNTNTLFLDDGTGFRTGDYSVYFDTNSFAKVVETLYYQASSPDEFIRQVWQIVGQLSDYASDDEEEIPRFPSETMLAGGGDCEDLSILFASMIKAAPTDWYVDLVYVDSDRVLDPQDPDHVIVYIDTGKRTYLIETTSDTVMEPYTSGVRGWLNSQVHLQKDTDRYPLNLH